MSSKEFTKNFFCFFWGWSTDVNPSSQYRVRHVYSYFSDNFLRRKMPTSLHASAPICSFLYVFFQLLRFNWLLMFTIILSNITLLIHPISFLAGLISLMLGLFSESSFYSFIVTKQLLSLLMCSLFTMSLCFKTAYFSWWFFLLYFQQLPCI